MIIRIRSIVFSDTCVGAQNVGADYYATRLGIYSCRCGLMSWNSRIPRAIHIFPTGVSIKGSMHERLPFLNARPMRRLGVSRRDLFFELDRPALKPLPGEPMKTPSGGCAGLDYHFDIDGHYYSAPRRAARRPSRLRPSSCAARESVSPCMVEDQTGPLHGRQRVLRRLQEEARIRGGKNRTDPGDHAASRDHNPSDLAGSAKSKISH
jgi:hypothetical protein